jgi:hypothetical protein
VVQVATGKTRKDGSPDVVVLVTNRLDLDAALLAVSDCVKMYQNGQGENVAFFWHQICCGARLGDSEPLAMARDAKKTNQKAFFLSGCQEENCSFSNRRY